MREHLCEQIISHHICRHVNCMHYAILKASMENFRRVLTVSVLRPMVTVMVLLRVWSYYVSGLITCLVLLRVWSYYVSGLITCLVLLRVWSYYVSGLITCLVLLRVWAYLVLKLQKKFNLKHAYSSLPADRKPCHHRNIRLKL